MYKRFTFCFEATLKVRNGGGHARIAASGPNARVHQRHSSAN